MDKQAESLDEILLRIHETLESLKAQPTTQSLASEKATAITRRAWLDKWLRIKPVHPQLKVLENDVYDFCAGYSKRPTRGYRMLIHGNNGAGKSHTAKAIRNWANRVAINLPLVSEDMECRLATSEFYNWPMVVERLKSGEWELIEEMIPVNLLVIDDLGAEHDPSKVGMEKFYLLLERREFKWTVITTNVSPASWESKFERRISSRFLRNCKHVALDEVPDFKA
jgi:DNA replication protein DnaC